LIAGVFDKKKLEQLFKTKTRDGWAALSSKYDVCLSPVLEMEEVYHQKQTKDRFIFKDVEIDHKTLKIYDKPYKTYTSL